MIAAESYPRAFAAVCRRVRRAQGHTQETLAECVGVHPDTVRRHERGSGSARITLVMAAKVAAGLRLRLAAMLEECERELDRGEVDGPERLAAIVELRRLDQARLDVALIVLRSLAELP